MAGFTDRDWGPAGTHSPRRRRRESPPEPDGREIFTATVVLTQQAARDREILDRAREDLTARVEAHATPRGMIIVQGIFGTDPPMEATGTVTMRLEAELLPRTDGEWPAIHQAMREDEADRAEALAAKTTVGDRLDALKRAAAVWSDPGLTDACRSAGRAMSGFSDALQDIGRAASRPFDRR